MDNLKRLVANDSIELQRLRRERADWFITIIKSIPFSSKRKKRNYVIIEQEEKEEREKERQIGT